MVAYQDDFVTLHQGTAIEVLRGMPEKSVHMAVTSPPYWGLRSYLPTDHPAKGQEIGTEKTPDEYVAKLVEVFAEVWRVLRDDGTLWVNIGDSYAANRGRGDSGMGPKQATNKGALLGKLSVAPGFKEKDLCMIPARLAIALCDWGWYLRQELVWAKDSCMPESVRDRCTRAHEFVYMLTKKPTYFYDQEAIREPHAAASIKRAEFGFETDATKYNKEKPDTSVGNLRNGSNPLHSSGRNARSVWRINPKPYPGSHFAVFPPELPMRCIKAGTSERGVCSECGAPWRRVIEKVEGANERNEVIADYDVPGIAKGTSTDRARRLGGKNYVHATKAVGWEPTCACGGSHDLRPGDLEVIATPTGERNGHDPSKETGRAGYNRPRHAEEGRRPITRYEQRHYASQLRSSRHREDMTKEAGPAFAHYVRTDRSGARPIPQPLLHAWIERGWIERVSPPEWTPPDAVPATVLDPFAGSGTTLYAARKLGRRSVGIDLDPKSADLLEARLGHQGVLL